MKTLDQFLNWNKVAEGTKYTAEQLKRLYTTVTKLTGPGGYTLTSSLVAVLKIEQDHELMDNFVDMFMTLCEKQVFRMAVLPNLPYDNNAKHNPWGIREYSQRIVIPFSIFQYGETVSIREPASREFDRISTSVCTINIDHILKCIKQKKESAPLGQSLMLVGMGVELDHRTLRSTIDKLDGKQFDSVATLYETILCDMEYSSVPPTTGLDTEDNSIC